MKACLILTAFTCVSVARAATTTEQRVAAIEKAIVPTLVIEGEPAPPVTLSARMDQLKVPAVSIAVFDGGRIEWAKAYGYADKERKLAAKTDTLFEAGSISKSVTALATLRLVEKGTLDLDANVNDRLKSWHLPDNEFTTVHKVTLHNILNHTAGTTVWGFPGYSRTEKVPTPIEVLEGKGNTEAIRVWKEPGQSWRYSGGGYTIMQVLLTDVTGRSFPDLLHDTVLEPLGMRSSTYEQPLPPKWQPRAASGYDGAGVKIAGAWHIYPEMAAAGLWTTATDLARFALAIQKMYVSDGGLLSRSMTHMMLTPGMNSDGLGVFITPDGKRFGHDGADEGFQSSLTAFIDSGSGIAILTNSDHGGRLARELMLTIARQYGWSGFPQTVKTVVQLSDADMARLSGHYKYKGDGDTGGGEFDLVPEHGHFIVKSAAQSDRELLAESPDKLFLREDGTTVEVGTQDGLPVLTVPGILRAVKVQ